MGQVTLPIGALVHDRYLILQVLGKGGFGTVYQVKDQQTENDLFALKEVIEPSKHNRKQLIHECELLQQLHHQALPRVYQVFDENCVNRTYMLMEYIEGRELEILRQQQPERHFPLSLVISLMEPIVAAISYLHQQHPPIVHRDIKPANIIVSEDGERAVLVDFGFAKKYYPDATTNTLRQGSRGYAAPEQYLSGTTTRTDIYALSATLYTLLTGVLPADAFLRLMQIEEKGLDPLVLASDLAAEIPVPVARALHRALSIKADDRFESVDAFWQAVKAPLPTHSSLTSGSAPPAHTSPSAPARQTVTAPLAVFQRKWPSVRYLRRIGIFIFTVLVLLPCFSLALNDRLYTMSQPVSEAAPRVPVQHQMITPSSSQATPTVSAPSPTSQSADISSTGPQATPTVSAPSPTPQPTNVSSTSSQATPTVSAPSPTPQPISPSPTSSNSSSKKHHGKPPKNKHSGQ